MEENKTENLQEAAQKGKPKKSAKQEAWEWVISIAVALLVVFVIRTFCFQIIKVDGDSMYSTLNNGERLFVTVFDAKLNNIERNDVVICRYPGRGMTDFVKRVVAVGGDTVMRKGNVTYVKYGDSGKIVAIDEMNANSYYYAGADYEYVMQDNEYFCVGDNRGNSHDSRAWDGEFKWDGVSATNRSDYVGPITGDMIVGKVRTVIWPLNSIRSVGEYEETA